jgi:hypothetical protein
VLEVCTSLVEGLPTDLRFQTQVAGDDDAIPDLVGFDANGAQRAILVAKFWAGLTDQQPVAYLGRLPADGSGVLLVVAPGQRFTTLWAELLRRCVAAGVPITEQMAPADEIRTASIGEQHALGLVSWRLLLSVVATRAATAGQTTVVHETEQLLGLCEQMDSEAFLPLRSEELFLARPQRIIEYVRLLDDVVAMCLQQGSYDKKGLRSAAGPGWYGHYMRMSGNGVFLHLDPRKWASVRPTPFWLKVQGRDWSNWEQERERLRPLEYETPPRLLRDADRGAPVVPLFPLLGVERAAVLHDLFRQLEEIRGLLTGSPTERLTRETRASEASLAEARSPELVPEEAEVDTAASARAMLSRRFEAALLETYETASKECGYKANYFLQMVRELGGEATGHRLLQSEGIAYGLTQLWKCNRLDISLEAQVLRPEFQSLISDEERERAGRRLTELDYRPPWL